MDTSLSQSFMFQNQDVRTTIINDEAWFAASDVCAILDIANVSDAVSKLDDDEKGIGNSDTLGGKQSLLFVNEAGVYHLIFTSRKPEAKLFRRWVTNEVLPTLRKTGSYTIQRPAQQLPAPIFKTNEEAWHAEPHCPCPTSQQLQTAILATVQRLQPYFKPGISVMTLTKYSEPIQSYLQTYGCHGLLEATESLAEQQRLLRIERKGAYYYSIPQIAGYLN